jgi:hypothetical protein
MSAKKETVKSAPAPVLDSEDSETLDREEWHPTPEQLEAHLQREVQMARHNLRVLLSGSKRPQSFKELRDCVLHSAETLDAALKLELTAGMCKRDPKGLITLA